MKDETMEKLKDIGKKKPLQTAILTTPEFDRGFAEGVKDGRRQAIDECIASVKKYDAYSVHVDSMKEDILKELEKLKL